MSQDKVSQQAAKSQTLNITLLGSEWKSSKGGLSTLNRELAIYLSQIQNVRVSLFVPEGACNNEDKREAESLGINILEAKKCVGLDPLVWLCNPPQDHTIDVIIGHGVKLGCPVQLVKRNAQFKNCKWVHVIHTASEEIGKFKDYDSPILKGEKKHWEEIELCERADLIVTVGPKLREIYDSHLRPFKNDEDVFKLIPGLFDREFGGLKPRANDEKNRFGVLLCGRGDEEDFDLKGYDIAVMALDHLRLNKGKHYFLRFVGAPEEKQDEVREKLLKCGIASAHKEMLTVRKFVESREGMKDLFSGVDMVIMPSKSEGFGLVALEALSAGLPILVGSNTGFAKAIQTIPFGNCFIVHSEDHVKWAEAIEDVFVRHKVILEEIKLFKEQYSKKYCWKRQCEELVNRLREMVCGTSTAQVVAVDDWVEKQPRTITEPFCQQHMEAESKTPQKLSKRRTLESEAEYGTSTPQVVGADDWVEKQPRTIKESVCQHRMEAGSRKAKKLSKRRNLESEAECGDAYRTALFSKQDQKIGMIRSATAAGDKEVLGKEKDSDEKIGMEGATSLSSEEVAHYQATGMIGTATAADDEEVLGNEEDSDETIGMKRVTLLFALSVFLVLFLLAPYQGTSMIRTGTAADDEKVLGKEKDSDEKIGMERVISLPSGEVAHNQFTGKIGTATAADDEEVLGKEKDSDEKIGMERVISLPSGKAFVASFMQIHINFTAIAADDEEVLGITQSSRTARAHQDLHSPSLTSIITGTNLENDGILKGRPEGDTDQMARGKEEELDMMIGMERAISFPSGEAVVANFMQIHINCTAIAADDEEVLGKEKDSDEKIGMERHIPLPSGEADFVAYLAIFINCTVIAADDEEVLGIPQSSRTARAHQDLHSPSLTSIITGTNLENDGILKGRPEGDTDQMARAQD